MIAGAIFYLLGFAHGELNQLNACAGAFLP